nr:odorant receptor 55 [Papilio dardanus]
MKIDTDKVLYQKAIKRVNTYLNIIGLHLKNNESEQNIKRLTNRWFFCLNFLSLLYDVLGEISWILKGSLSGDLALIDLTLLGPCIIMCFLGCVKSYYFFKEIPYAFKLINELSLLPSEIKQVSEEKTKYLQRNMNFLNIALKCLITLDSIGIIAFSIGPVIISISQYYKTGELNLLLPFFILYPFDAFNIYVWPFVYIHQVWSAVLAVFTVLGPDSLLYTTCVLINDHFYQLKHEVRLIFDNHDPELGIQDTLKKKIGNVVDFHMKLLRYLQLIETIYSKSTLCNVLTSSLLICFTGFNVMAVGNLIMVMPFIPFLLMVVGQIFLLCYYGDLIQKSNEEIIQAVYSSAWYEVKAPVAKNLIIILIRAQKPFKFTAYGFVDINMAAFTRIMSTSWSYFALLLSFNKTE